MSQSPWSSYGRRNNQQSQASDSSDAASRAARDAVRTQKQVKEYLARTLREFNEIRAGRAGYARIIEEALRPQARPESIEETLRRLSGGRPGGYGGNRSDPSSTV